MDLKKLKLAKECVGIVNQLYDLAEVPTEKRQAINDKADKYLLDQVLRLCGVSNSLPTKDAEFIYSLLPDWVKSKAPEGLDPTMYGTLSKEGDDEIQERVKQILGNVC